MSQAEFQQDWYRHYNQVPFIPLWEQGAPDFMPELGQPQPSLSLYNAPDAQGKGCVLVMAGGGYISKSQHEGPAVAKFLNTHGINAAVLDYRVIPYPKRSIEADARRAVRYLRCHAGELGIDGERIAALGFSAGGNLATMAAVLGDNGNPDADDPVERCSSRIQALVLCYPGLNLVEEYDADMDMDPEDCYFDLRLTPDMKFPPTFLWQSYEDRLIHYSASFRIVEAMEKMKAPVEMHLFPYGPHGQGLAPYDAQKGNDENYLTEAWGDLCVRWLKFYGFDGKEPKK